MVKQRSAAFSYFNVLPDCAKCKSCDRIIKNVQATNLKKHLKFCQPDAYKTIQEKEGKLCQPSSNNNAEPFDAKKFFEKRDLAASEIKLQETGYSKLAAMPQLSLNVLRSEEFINFVYQYKKGFKV